MGWRVMPQPIRTLPGLDFLGNGVLLCSSVAPVLVVSEQ